VWWSRSARLKKRERRRACGGGKGEGARGMDAGKRGALQGELQGVCGRRKNDGGCGAEGWEGESVGECEVSREPTKLKGCVWSVCSARGRVCCRKESARVE